MSGLMTDKSFNVVATTRRSWSKEQKRAIVAEIDIGGATLSQVARRHGIHTSLLFRWRKTLGCVIGAPPLADVPSASTAPTFIPVMLPLPPPASLPPKPGAVEIVLANGRTVRVGTDVDAQALAGIVDALEKSR